MMSVNWLISQANQMKDKKTFEDEFPFEEESKCFKKMVKVWEKFHDKQVPWKRPKPGSVASETMSSKVKKSKKVPKDIQKVTSGIQNIQID